MDWMAAFFCRDGSRLFLLARVDLDRYLRGLGRVNRHSPADRRGRIGGRVMEKMPDLSQDVWYIHPYRDLQNAAGPFYAMVGRVEGMQAIAPRLSLLVSSSTHPPSYSFAKMPETAEELEQTCEILLHSQTPRLRYGGQDRSIIRRLGNSPIYSDHVLHGGEVVFYGDDGLPLLSQTARKLPRVASLRRLPAAYAPADIAHRWMNDVALRCIKREEATEHTHLNSLRNLLKQKLLWLQDPQRYTEFPRQIDQFYWKAANAFSAPPPHLRRDLDDAHPLTLIMVRMACQVSLRFVYWIGFLAELHASYYAMREENTAPPRRPSRAWMTECAEWMRKYYDIACLPSSLLHRREELRKQRQQLDAFLQSLRDARQNLLHTLHQQAHHCATQWKKRQADLETALFESI